MKYLLLVHYRETDINAMSQNEWDALNAECKEFGDAIDLSGRRLAGEALQQAATATSVRVRNGKVFTTDGPFAETKEQLAGFYMIDARDLNEAIQLAGQVPPARFGSVEVRPVRELIRSHPNR